VLGTHFNVNTYKEEPTNNTTLLEGSVRIKTVHTSLTLKPGQQGQFNPKTEKLSLAANPDIEQVMAWKNGLFNFNGADLKTVMTQLERWYDVTVVYEGSVPQMTFGGKMQRSLNLSDVTGALSAVGVKFRIEGKRLVVMH
jgi:ferric-dicitrate binding protein FerR (iron transport regulator)